MDASGVNPAKWPATQTVLGKSAEKGLHGAELLTSHSEQVKTAAEVLARRIDRVGVLATVPDFWEWAVHAALLHDAGKTASGCQVQLTNGGIWGERHEVLSLAYVHTLYPPGDDRLMVATGVLFHHRPLNAPSGDRDGTRTLRRYGRPDFPWERKQADLAIPDSSFHDFVAWYAEQLGIAPPEADGSEPWQLARDLFREVARWWESVDQDDGLRAILLQGAVTLADRSASAGVTLQRHMPLPRGYVHTLEAPYQHQRDAAAVHGHMMMLAPTGAGKTEGGLAWASTQLESMPGEPRLVWTLPYQASLNAIHVRFESDLVPEEGEDRASIGLLHGKIAQVLFARAADDDDDKGSAQQRAVAGAKAARLFAQRVRVATPHQLLRGVVAGPSCSSILLEQVNCLFVLDELHAYDPVVFGRLCALMRFWERLGGRVAVLSATLAPQLQDFIIGCLGQPVETVRALPGSAPLRHRLVVDEEPVTAPSSLQRISDWLEEGHSVLVVVNTVATAQYVFGQLESDARSAWPGEDTALLLHSRFRWCDRAKIEKELEERHAERQEGVLQRGGLVVATQAVEVSLCLDFDRGVTETAPLESVIQRMGRVNRLGRHPDGRVDVVVHQVEKHPYKQGLVDDAWNILARHDGETVSEEAVAAWLEQAYETESGKEFLCEAQRAFGRFEGEEGFLDFAEPFEDRVGWKNDLERDFDTVEVVLRRDLADYRARLDQSTGSPLSAADLLIPISFWQLKAIENRGRCVRDRKTGTYVLAIDEGDDTYTETTGLRLDKLVSREHLQETVL